MLLICTLTDYALLPFTISSSLNYLHHLKQLHLNYKKKIVDPIFQDRVWYARMYYLATGDRDTAAQMIKGYQYLQAHLFLGKHMHALVIIDNLRITNESNQPVVDLEPAYPVTEGYYRPVFASMVEVLRETCMPSHAPTAAISAATCSI
jgi:hypothetical protein